MRTHKILHGHNDGTQREGTRLSSRHAAWGPSVLPEGTSFIVAKSENSIKNVRKYFILIIVHSRLILFNCSMYCLDRFCKALFFYYIIKLFLSLTGFDIVLSNFIDGLRN